MENQYEPIDDSADIVEESEQSPQDSLEESSELQDVSFNSPGEEVEEEPSEKRRHRPSAYNRIQEIQREKYQALDELNRMREENEVLRGLAHELNYKAEESGNAAMIHYDKSMNLKLEQAKLKKAQALENGDIQAQLDADVDIASATNAIQQINSWRYQQEIDMQNRQQQEKWQQQQAQYQQPIAPNPQITTNWLQNNAWYFPQSKSYNPEMAEAVAAYSDKLENFLYRSGRPDLIMSEEYFQNIDEYVSSLNQNSERSGLNMKPMRGGVSPVRNSGFNSSRTQKIALDSNELEMARRLGVKKEEFLQQKIEDIKKFGKSKRLYGR